GTNLLPLTGGFWQPTSAGFGAFDYGSLSYSQVNYQIIGRGPGQLRPTTVVNGPSGVLNRYVVFQQDTQISVGQIMADAGKAGVATAQKRLDQDVKLIDAFNE